MRPIGLILHIENLRSTTSEDNVVFYRKAKISSRVE